MDKIIGLGNALVDVLATLKDDTLCDLADAVVGENKQLLCLCDAEVDEVVVRRCAHIPHSGILHMHHCFFLWIKAALS